MRRAGVSAVLVLSAGLLAGCDDDSSTVTLGDLIGSWVADQFEFTNQQNRAETVDFVGFGIDVAFTVAANGRYTMAAVAPGGAGGDFIKGSLLVEEGYLLVTDDESPGGTVAFSASLSGGVLTIFSDEMDYDFDEPSDGIEEPADLRAVFRVATGTTVADLAGTWEGTEFRFVSSPTPTDTIDVIDGGGGVSVTLLADGRYDLSVTLPGEPPDDESGVLMVGGDMLYMIDDVDPGHVTIFEFGLDGDTVTLRGESAIDFDVPPDDIEDPAIIEMVLVRQ